jgi:hypothetical protein
MQPTSCTHATYIIGEAVGEARAKQWATIEQVWCGVMQSEEELDYPR